MKYLVVESKDGMHGHKFALNRTAFAVFGGTLHVANGGVHFRFSLERFDYRVEKVERKRNK